MLGIRQRLLQSCEAHLEHPGVLDIVPAQIAGLQHGLQGILELLHDLASYLNWVFFRSFLQGCRTILGIQQGTLI